MPIVLFVFMVLHLVWVLVFFPLLFLAIQGSTEDEQHMTKGTSLIESQHHHLLHCLEKTTVSSSTILLLLTRSLCLAQALYGKEVHAVCSGVAHRQTQETYKLC